MTDAATKKANEARDKKAEWLCIPTGVATIGATAGYLGYAINSSYEKASQFWNATLNLAAKSANALVTGQKPGNELLNGFPHLDATQFIAGFALAATPFVTFAAMNTISYKGVTLNTHLAEFLSNFSSKHLIEREKPNPTSNHMVDEQGLRPS